MVTQVAPTCGVEDLQIVFDIRLVRDYHNQSPLTRRASWLQ